MPNTPDPPPLPRIIENPPPLPIQLGQNAEDLETNFPVWMPFLCMLATCFGIMCYRVASEDYQVNKSTNSSNTFDQVASKKANVTSRYWGGLLKQSEEVLKKHSDSDLDESVLEEWAGKIQTLPINGVDADLVNHAMDFVTLLNERALLIRQWKQVLAGTEQHMTHISSPRCFGRIISPRDEWGPRWKGTGDDCATKRIGIGGQPVIDHSARMAQTV
jgi:hypothetical protein